MFGPPGGRLNGIGVRGVFSFRNNFIEVRSGVVTSFYDGIALYGSGEIVEHIRAIANLQEGITVGAFGTGNHRVLANTAMNNGKWYFSRLRSSGRTLGFQPGQLPRTRLSRTWA